jgi:hypothetical protein
MKEITFTDHPTTYSMDLVVLVDVVVVVVLVVDLVVVLVMDLVVVVVCL